MRSRALCVAAIYLAGVAACGDDEPDPSAGSATTSTSVVTAETPMTSDPATISAVLASRLRGEFPGIHDTVVTVDGDDMRIEFAVGEGETPGDTRALATLAAEELRTFAPEVLDGVDEVTAFVDGPDGPVEETYVLHGDLLPVE